MTSTNIEWTDEVWNPITGCSKVSQGCKNCYAERVFPRPYPGRAFTDIRLHAERLDAPLHWRKPRRVFVNSMSDLFHDDVPDEFIDQIFAVMALAPQHTFQVLTKRAERMSAYLSAARAHPVGMAALDKTLCSVAANPKSQVGAGCMLQGDIPHLKVWPLPNVWLGVSVEDQETADYRIPLLLRTPAAVRWISAEPLLGPVDLGKWLWSCCGNTTTGGEYMGQREEVCCNRPEPRDLLDWVVAGGESGPHARPMHPDWLRLLRDQCESAGVSFFFKQWGEWAPNIGAVDGWQINDDPEISRFDHKEWEDGQWSETFRPMWCDFEDGNYDEEQCVSRLGKKTAGRLLDGIEHSEYPNAHK